MTALQKKEKEQVCSTLKKFGLSFSIAKFSRNLGDIYLEIGKRYTTENSKEKDWYYDKRTRVSIWRGIKNGKTIVGIAKRHPSDRFCEMIGFHLCLCCAHGWKDLEEELLEFLK